MAWWDDLGGAVGNVVAVPLGGLGAVGGGIAGLASGGGLSGFGEGWAAGAAFSPAGNLGTDARTHVRMRNAQLQGGWRTASEFLGPPETAGQAWTGLALSAAIPGAGAVARPAIQGGQRVIGGLIARVAGRATATTAGRTVTYTAARTGTQAGTRTSTKILTGLGLGALGFEALGLEDNPLIPNFLEKPLDQAGDSAATVAKWAPALLLGLAVVVGASMLRKGKGTTV